MIELGGGGTFIFFTMFKEAYHSQLILIIDIDLILVALTIAYFFLIHILFTRNFLKMQEKILKKKDIELKKIQCQITKNEVDLLKNFRKSNGLDYDCPFLKNLN
jgi:hypothetical protein